MLDLGTFGFFTDRPSGLAQGSLMSFWLHNCSLDSGGELTAGEVGPVQANV
jgi:hypothetical protein